MKYVYLAGPIEGCTSNEIHGWRTTVQSLLHPNVRGITPYRGDEKMNGAYDPTISKSIHMKNMLDSKSCDALLAYMPSEIVNRRPSYGTTFEIAWFDMMQKPIVMITDCNTIRNHPLMQTSVGWFHTDFEDAADTLNTLLGVY